MKRFLKPLAILSAASLLLSINPVYASCNDYCEFTSLGSISKRVKGGYEIQVLSIQETATGLQVQARAWKGKQIGFGKKGEVDIERFNFINISPLVPDPAGSLRFTRGLDVIEEYRMRNDPEEALLQAIADTIDVKKEKHDDKNIKVGKIGSTTTTVYPDANPESTSVDGYVESNASASWDTTHDESDGAAAYPSANPITARSYGCNGGCTIERGILLFDTSSIPDGDAVSSATLSLYITAVSDGDNDAQGYINITTSTPASNTNIVTDDYDQVGSVNNPTKQSSDIDLSSMSTGAYEDWALNATGIGNINKTGISKFGVRQGHDIEDIQVADGTTSGIIYSSAENAGTTQDPKLVIEHAEAAGGGGAAPSQGIFFIYVERKYA